MTTGELIRLDDFRKKLFVLIKRALTRDSHHKHYEGQVNVLYSMPGYFDEGHDSRWKLAVLCYLLIPGRSQDFTGRTLAECLSKAEEEMERWEAALEELEEADKEENRDERG